MASTGMLCHVALVRTDVSEECFASIIRVTRISVFRLLVTAIVVASSPNLVTLMMEMIRPSESSVLTRVTWHNNPEDGIFIVAAVKTSNLTQRLSAGLYSGDVMCFL
jgi:hypothetical protein